MVEEAATPDLADLVRALVEPAHRGEFDAAESLLGCLLSPRQRRRAKRRRCSPGVELQRAG
jgi:hypothetical protein